MAIKKISVLFQTTELSDSGNKIIVATDNEKSEDKLFGYFQEASRLNADENGFKFGKNMVVFEETTIQKESNRKSKNILILLKKHIALLSEVEVASIKEICRTFSEKELPTLKKQAESFTNEKYQSIVKSDVINGFENKLLDNIPALNKIFKPVDKSKFNKYYIGIIASIIVVLLGSVSYGRRNSKDMPSIAGETKPTSNRININGRNYQNNEFPIDEKSTENNRRQQTTSKKEYKADLTFIDEFCKKNECDKSVLLPIIEKKIGFSDLDKLSEKEVSSLKTFLYSNDWALVNLNDKEKTVLIEFFDLNNTVLTRKKINDLKDRLNQFYYSYTALIAQKDSVTKYVDLFKAILPDEKERLAFVVAVSKFSGQVKTDDDNSVVFNQFDCEIIELFKNIFIGDKSLVVTAFLNPKLSNERDIKSIIYNCKSINTFCDVYNKRLQKIINAELSVKLLIKKFMDIDYKKHKQNSDFATFADLKENDENITKTNIKEEYLNQKLNSNLGMEASVFDEQLAIVNKLYQEFLKKSVELGRVK